MKRGTFIVIEGTDGSGKSEQFKRLVARARRAGKKVFTFDFPQYGKPSAHFVKEYLNGKYGTWREVGPYRASVFYAVDRFDIAPTIRKALASGAVVIANRYATSNMGHQGAKLVRAGERKKLFRWLDEFEYRIMGIPRPDMVVVLHVPAATAQRLVDRKGRREYVNGKKRDIHEADITHLERAERTYLEMVKMFPKEFRLIECVERGELLSIDAIHDRVWKIVRRSLKV
jgi:dTMP kinase